MRFTIVTVLALASYVVAQRGATDNCDQQRLLSCTAGLGTFWKTDTSNIWKSLDYFTRAVDSNIHVPYIQNNYLNVCNGFSQFYACLGQYNIRNCLGTIGFLGMGFDPTTAYAYEGTMAAWRFKCGGGFFMTYQNAGLSQCTQNVHMNYNDEMMNYITQYTVNVTVDPSGSCTYAQTLMNNIGTTYGTGCRTVDQEQGRVYGCQSIREYTNAQFSHCQHVTTCKKQ